MKTLSFVVAMSVYMILPASAIDSQISKEKAESIALKKAQGKVFGWLIDSENGHPSYEFEMKQPNSRICEVVVDANSGKATDLNVRVEEGGPQRNTIIHKTDFALAKQAKISREQAQGTALRKVPGEIKAWELETTNGKLRWEFEIASEDKTEAVEIDAATGAIKGVHDRLESHTTGTDALVE